MDFAFTEEQEAVRELAARILGDLSTPENLKRVEATEERFDRDLWRALADAGLLGLAVAEAHGGAGLGFLEACIVLEEAGRVAAAVPLGATMVLGALALSRFGSPEQQLSWLGRVVSGAAVLTAALAETGGDPWRPTTKATKDTKDTEAGGGAWRLDGAKAYVPAGMVAELMVVSALSDDGVGLFLVDPGAPGVTRRPQEATDGRIEAEVELSDVAVPAAAVLVAPGPGEAALAPGPGEAALAWLLDRACAAICVEVAGACQAASKLTAQYTTQREQFGKPVATFQAVGQRAADAYIDAEAVRLTAWQAVWRLANDLPASAEVAVAKFWADDGAQRVVHAAQHLHGGVGVDREYPLHRYYLLTKHLALSLGGGTASLLRLGEILAATP